MIRHPDLLNVRCPHCDSENVDIVGSNKEVDRYQCNECGKAYAIEKKTGWVRRG
jgi:transposase-like protein